MSFAYSFVSGAVSMKRLGTDAPAAGALVLPNPATDAQLLAAFPAYQGQTPALLAYAKRKLDMIRDGGVTANVGTSAAPVNVSADTDANGIAVVNGILANYASGATTGNFTWYQTSGAVSLTQAQIQALAGAITAFVGSVYAAWQAVVNAINSGAIATMAGIDAPPAGVATWPSNS